MLITAQNYAHDKGQEKLKMSIMTRGEFIDEMDEINEMERKEKEEKGETMDNKEFSRTVKNFSRHEFNIDQIELLKMSNYTPEGKALAPFFTSGDDLIEKIQGQNAAIVAPINIVLDALLKKVTTKIFSWHADAAARKRGKFAATGVTVYYISDGKVTGQMTLRKSPTVETDFRTGECVPYEEEN